MNTETLRQRARKLIGVRKVGALSTISRERPGYPFGSVVSYAADPQGRPLFLLSGLAVHSRNLAADAKASLLVVEPETETDPLASARVTVMGEVRPVPEADSAAASKLYLERHPEAAEYLQFGDFVFYRLNVNEVYYIAGFGEMGWVAAEDYTAGPL